MQENRYKWTLKCELVKDVFHGVCHQRYEKRLEQQKIYPNVVFMLQKRIWNYN